MKAKSIKGKSPEEILTALNTGSILILANVFVLIAACTNNLKKSRNELLAGMYKLHSIEVQDAKGNWQEEWASDGTGYIIYDGLGHMAVQITPKGYEAFKWLSEDESIDPEKIKAKADSMAMDELKASVEEFVSNYVYVANYSVADTADVVTHYRLSHTIPSAWNTTVQRRFIFNGDTLELYNDADKRKLKWTKQK